MSSRSNLVLCYNFFVGRWILSALLVTAGSYWFILLQFFGKKLGLLNATQDLTTLGHWLTWPLFIGSLCFALVKSLGDNWNDIAQAKAQTVLGGLLESVNAITTDKLTLLSG